MTPGDATAAPAAGAFFSARQSEPDPRHTHADGMTGGASLLAYVYVTLTTGLSDED